MLSGAMAGGMGAGGLLGTALGAGMAFYLGTIPIALIVDPMANITSWFDYRGGLTIVSLIGQGATVMMLMGGVVGIWSAGRLLGMKRPSEAALIAGAATATTVLLVGAVATLATMVFVGGAPLAGSQDAVAVVRYASFVGGVVGGLGVVGLFSAVATAIAVDGWVLPVEPPALPALQLEE